MRKSLLVAVGFWLLGVGSQAQVLPDEMLNRDFAAQVKSMNEFVARFNGTDSTYKGGVVRLFDYQMSHDGMTDTEFRQHISDFVQMVEQGSLHIRLTDGGMYAEVKTMATVCEKAVPLTLVLHSETYQGDYVRWAIVGAKGLAAAGIIDTSRVATISPVEHELHFMTIDELFTHDNCQHIMAYRGSGVRIDELSVLLTLAMTDKIRIRQVDDVTLHCMDIPGYVFTINELGRRGDNCGWLITNLKKMNDNDKTIYLKQLFGL